MVGSLLADIDEFTNLSRFETLKSSTTYIRLIIFSIAIYYLSLNYPNFYKHTYYSFLISLIATLFFSYFQLLTGYSIFFDDLTVFLDFFDSLSLE